MMNDVYAAIYALLGAAPAHIKTFGITRFSTSAKPANRDGWVKACDSGIYHFGCWRQGLTGSFCESRTLFQKPQRSKAFVQLAADQKLRNSKWVASENLAAWGGAEELKPTGVVNQYLIKRGIHLPKLPAELRQGMLDYFEDGQVVGTFPAMLAAVTSPCGEMVALHRTYLAADGSKAAVDHVKKLTRTSGSLAGASIKFGEPTAVQGQLTLGVAEGIETALACRLGAAIPTWSCISAVGVQRFVWPDGLQSLVIFADNDASGVGQDAARKLAKRAVEAGLECRILIPEKVGCDWLDVYAGRVVNER